MKRGIVCILILAGMLTGCGSNQENIAGEKIINKKIEVGEAETSKNNAEEVIEESEEEKKPEMSFAFKNYKNYLSEDGKLEIVRKPSQLSGLENIKKLNALPKYDPSMINSNIYDLRSKDLRELDLEDRGEELLYMDFNSLTKWPEKLPEGFDPIKIMEIGKNPGLGLRELHKKGYTGKGIGIALIDTIPDVNHIEYKDRLKLFEEIKGIEHCKVDMHGTAVTSLAAGKNVGVAPEADIYNIAAPSGYDDINGNFVLDLRWKAEAIDRVVEINKTLPEENKIRVISISLGFGEWMDEYKAIEGSIKAAEAEGIHVIHISGQPFWGAGRDPMSDPDDFKSYTKAEYWKNKENYGGVFGLVLLPMDSRTMASASGSEDYQYQRINGMSWVAPYAAGVYALACEAVPDVTPEEFWKAAKETGDIPEFYGEDVDKPSFILNPEKLIKRLESNQKRRAPKGTNRKENQGMYRTVLSAEGEINITSEPDVVKYFHSLPIPKELPVKEEYGMKKIDLRSLRLEKLDLKDEYDNLMISTFDTKTQWPEDLPEGFNPKGILEKGKNPGFGIRKIHEKGINGKGVGIAIIDRALLVNHKEYSDRVRLYEEVHNLSTNESSPHGSAVASLALGETVGVAPKAGLYYIACQAGVFKDKEYYTEMEWIKKSIDRIREVNKMLTDDEKIRVISLSVGFSEDSEEYKEIASSVEAAEKEGIYFINIIRSPIWGLGRLPNEDPDEISSYKKGSFWEIKPEWGNGEGCLLVPMDARTYASSVGVDEYEYVYAGGSSWTAPYAAGLFALACQVNPEITLDEFWKIAMETGDKAHFYEESVENPGVIVNPERLLEKIEDMAINN